ncbi:aldo/keto reductase [soil metagenome]
MDKRRIGNSEIEVQPFALGTNVFGWNVDQAQAFKILDKFQEEGFELIDTADVYANWVPGNEIGSSETIIGNWMKERGNRDKIVLATKVGSEVPPFKKDLKYEHIIQGVEGSLKRLRTEYIDLYQAHFDNEEVPVDETLKAFDKLVGQGKVKVIGASNLSPERLEESLEYSSQNDLAQYQCFQPGYNLYDREVYEKNLEPVVRKYGLGVITYFSLARGFLSGKYRNGDDSVKSLRGSAIVKNYLNEKGFRILETLDQIASKHNASPTMIALSWLVSKDSVSAAIVSATNSEQLIEIAEGIRLELDMDSINLLDIVSAW